MGKKAKRRQRAAMNEMNAMVQKQADEFKAKQEVAQERADKTRSQYEDFEFKSQYEGIENRFEDMTVDMRAADFQVQQGQQQRANIMQSLKGAAGSSGVAGLAQSLANQGQLQTQQIAAGIGQQERQNKMMAAQEGSRIDMTQRGGQAGVQAAEAGQQATLLGMDYGSLAGANKGYQGALANQMSGMGMKVDMYGQQAENNWFKQATDGVNAAANAKKAFKCIPKGIHIDTINGSVAVEDVKPGDVVMGYNGEPTKVLQKHEYLEDPTKERFYRVEFDSGAIVDVCDMHRIKGERAIDITEDVKSKEVYKGVEFSYDLLTEDSGYRIDGIPVNSMIPEMAIGIAEIIKNK